MNRNKFIVRFTAVLMITALLLCGCKNSAEQEKENPVPVQNTVEKSSNSFGARYTFSLGRISREMTDDLEALKLSMNSADWTTLSTGLVDDNGVQYSSYSYHDNGVTLTAAVEDGSGKVMNLGCGCQSKELESSAYRLSFLRLAAAIAVHAGGYDGDAAAYFTGLYITLLNSEDDTFCYGNSLYIKSVDEDTTVLMTAPCSEKVISEKNYKEYPITTD